jgi:hypothetical protein
VLPELFHDPGPMSHHLLRRAFEESEQDKAVYGRLAPRLVSTNGASLSCDPGLGGGNVAVSPLKTGAE